MNLDVSDGIATKIGELAQEHPGLAKSKDNLFVLWFLEAYVFGRGADNTARHICGATKDGGFDAIAVDSQSRMVHVVQGKLRQFGKAEPTGEIDKFVRDCADLCASDRDTLNALLSRVNPLSKDRIREAAKRIASDGYEPHFYFVTTGRVSKEKRDRYRHDARRRTQGGTLDIVGSDELRYVFRDYRDGIAPPVPLASLDVEHGNSTIVQRDDPKSKTRSWIFPTHARSLSALYELCGIRLFAKNIRGYLGESTSINKAMAQTLLRHPDEFFYLNNGVTIICSQAEYIQGDINKIQLWNAQVINGQQTVRTIYETAGKNNASVLVKVMQVPEDHYSKFISRVVAATNWQNAIKSSDLTANDERQIQIQMAFRKLGYQYIRKRQSKSEARREAGLATRQIKRDELAQAIAACELDPREVRSGVEHLFETYYGKLFQQSDPYFYLIRWWLRRAATVQSRGDSDSGYAKWLVMSAMWRHLDPALKTRARKQEFVSQCQSEDSPVWDNLCVAIDKMYIVAYQFYVTTNGKRKPSERLDISRFYRDTKNLHEAFLAYWRSSANKQRQNFNKRLATLSKEIDRALSE